MEKIQKAIVSTLRSSGQALDKIGRTVETNSYVEKCKSYYILIIFIFI